MSLGLAEEKQSKSEAGLDQQPYKDQCCAILWTSVFDCVSFATSTALGVFGS